jgi:hypothetical protein
LPKCALPHRPNSPGRATLLQRTVDLTLTPRLFRTNSVRGPKCPVPPWSRTVGEPRAAARLCHFSDWICISQNFSSSWSRPPYCPNNPDQQTCANESGNQVAAVGAIAGDWTSVGIFVTGRRLQAGGPVLRRDGEKPGPNGSRGFYSPRRSTLAALHCHLLFLASLCCK